MLLLNSVFALLFVVVGVIVTALAVPDSVWKRRSITAVLLLGAAWLATTIVIHERVPGNEPYFSNGLAYVVAAVDATIANPAFQILAVLVAGLVGGWWLKSLWAGRQQAKTRAQAGHLDWKSSYDVLELAEPSKVNSRREQLSKIAGLNVGIAEFDRLIEAEKKAGVSSNKYAKKRDKYERWKSNEVRIHEVMYLDQIEDLHSKLRAGILIAKGFLLPVEKDSTFVSISPERWHFLRLNGDFSKASGENLTYAGVLIARSLQT